MDLRAVLFAIGVAALGQGVAHAQSYLLSAPLAPGQDVRGFEVSPDGRWAIFADGHLYAVSLRGDAHPFRLDERPVYYTGTISPDSRRVVYFTAEPSLASVPIDGTEPPFDLEAYGEMKITPDGRTVVVRGPGALVSVPIDHPAEPVLVHTTSRIVGFVLTPDSKKVVYVIEGAFSEGGLAYAAELDGSTPPVQLNTNATIATTYEEYLLITPDSSRLVFRQGRASTVGRLDSVPLDASASPVQLSVGTMNVNWYVGLMPKITADGTVVFKHDILSHVYSVPASGDAPAVLLSEGIPGPFTLDYEPGLDGHDVLFVAGSSATEWNVYRTPIDGSTPPVPLGAPGQNAVFFEFDPAGERAALLGRAEPDDRSTLWSVPVDGSAAPLRLADSPDEIVGEDYALDFTPDGSWIVYTTAHRYGASYELEDSEVHLFAVPTDGSAEPVRLDPRMARGGGVRYTRFRPDGVTGGILFRLAAGGKRVVYMADQRENDVFELFSAELPERFEAGPLRSPRIPALGKPRP